jgi:hypothetical protein
MHKTLTLIALIAAGCAQSNPPQTESVEQAICPPDVEPECFSGAECYAPSSAYRATCIGSSCFRRCSYSACTGTMRNCDYASGDPSTCETNINTNAAHCGACGHACATGQTCSNGVCVGGPTACFPECVSCGPASSAMVQKTCSSGVCGEAACPVGRRNCNLVEGCETNVTCDPSNCGGCGVACAAGQQCCNGVCATSC